MFVVNNFQLILNNAPVKFTRSPNVDQSLQERHFVIIHYTSGSSLAGAVSWLVNPASQVSSHLVIGRDGEVAQLVPFNFAAWHAGVSAWKGYQSLNRFSIGIELNNAGMLQRNNNRWVSEFGKIYPDSDALMAAHKLSPNVMYGWHKYTEIQLNTAAEVVAALVRAYGVSEILGHDDIAPKRKWDPGPAFPMEQFKQRVAALVAGEVGGTVPIDIPPKKTYTSYKVENLDSGESAEYKWSAAFKPVTLLPVPYISQLGAGADVHANDCGAASAVMLLWAYQRAALTPNEFYTRFSIPGDPYLSVTQVRAAMTSLGLLTDFKATLSLQDIFGALAGSKPLIVLLRYKVLYEAGLTEKSFQGPHFAVAVGMDCKYIYIHDPLYTSPLAGAARAYPLDIFWQAWKEVANDPILPNPERSAIIPTAGIGFPMTRKVKVNISTLNVRSGPGLNNQAVGMVKNGEVLEVTRELSGWGEIGVNRWILLSHTVAA